MPSGVPEVVSPKDGSQPLTGFIHCLSATQSNLEDYSAVSTVILLFFNWDLRCGTNKQTNKS